MIYVLPYPSAVPTKYREAVKRRTAGRGIVTATRLAVDMYVYPPKTQPNALLMTIQRQVMEAIRHAGLLPAGSRIDRLWIVRMVSMNRGMVHLVIREAQP
jgi:hypothetical protein